MRLLVDSHILIWLLYEPQRLTAAVRQVLEEADSVMVSTASQWELAIKYINGKLAYSPQTIQAELIKLGTETLEIKPEHISHLPNIKLPHKDPFDAMLIAQSEVEDYVFVTADKNLLKSKYRTLAA